MNTLQDILRNWIKEEYTITSESVKNFSEEVLQDQGVEIHHVFSNSPADYLGICVGDVLLFINSSNASNLELYDLYSKSLRFRSYMFNVYNRQTKKLKIIRSKIWLYGIQTRLSLLAINKDFRIVSGDTELVENYWQSGDYKKLESVYVSSEILLHRYAVLDGNPFLSSNFTVPHPLTPIPKDIHASKYPYFALVALAAGKIERCRYFLDELYTILNSQDIGFPTIPWSIVAYIESCLAELNSNRDLAIDWIHEAIKRDERQTENYRRLSQLTGQKITIPTAPHLHTKLNFSLNKSDPANIIKQDEGVVSLEKELLKLEKNQLQIIICLGQYRSNYFYYFGLKRVAELFNKLREIFPSILIITHGNYSVYPEWRDAEKDFLKSKKIEFSILDDPEQSVTKDLSLFRVPTSLAVNSKREIVAEGLLYDETIIWNAVAAALSQ